MRDSEFEFIRNMVYERDSTLVRRLARKTLQRGADIDVVGVATDPYEARDWIAELAPDVITLDLEMPRMDGLTFLRLPMDSRPTPVVVMSSLTSRGSDFAFEALRLGAVEVIGKPQGTHSFGAIGNELIAKVKLAAAVSNPRRNAASGRVGRPQGRPNAPGVRVPPRSARCSDGQKPLRETGARTFAQDDATSVVYGMLRAARETGAAESEFPLTASADHLVRSA